MSIIISLGVSQVLFRMLSARARDDLMVKGPTVISPRMVPQLSNLSIQANMACSEVTISLFCLEELSVKVYDSPIRDMKAT